MSVSNQNQARGQCTHFAVQPMYTPASLGCTRMYDVHTRAHKSSTQTHWYELLRQIGRAACDDVQAIFYAQPSACMPLAAWLGNGNKSRLGRHPVSSALMAVTDPKQRPTFIRSRQASRYLQGCKPCYQYSSPAVDIPWMDSKVPDLASHQ